MVRRQRPRARHRAPACRTPRKRRAKRLGCASYAPLLPQPACTSLHHHSPHCSYMHTTTHPRHAPPATRPPTKPADTTKGPASEVTRECGPGGHWACSTTPQPTRSLRPAHPGKCGGEREGSAHTPTNPSPHIPPMAISHTTSHTSINGQSDTSINGPPEFQSQKTQNESSERTCERTALPAL